MMRVVKELKPSLVYSRVKQTRNYNDFIRYLEIEASPWKKYKDRPEFTVSKGPQWSH